MNFNLINVQIPEIIVMALFGAILLLFGYRVKQIAFFVIWFLIGYTLMQNFMPTLMKWVPQMDTQLFHILMPIAGGLLLAMMGLSIEKLCVGGLVFGLTMIITMKYFGNDVPTLCVGAIIGVILAAAAVNMMKPAIIITTALAGAYCLTVALLTWQKGIDPTIFYFPILIGLTAVGAVFQSNSTKHL